MDNKGGLCKASASGGGKVGEGRVRERRIRSPPGTFKPKTCCLIIVLPVEVTKNSFKAVGVTKKEQSDKSIQVGILQEPGHQKPNSQLSKSLKTLASKSQVPSVWFVKKMTNFNFSSRMLMRTFNQK